MFCAIQSELAHITPTLTYTHLKKKKNLTRSLAR